MTKKRILAYTLLLLTAMLWGFAAPIVKYTLAFIDPIGFLFYRFLLVSLLFSIPFLITFKKKPVSPIQLTKLGLVGVLGGPITLLLIFFGAEKTTAIDASLIVAMAPILIVLAGSIFLKEKVTRWENLGLLVALAGTAVTIIQPLIEGAAFARVQFSPLVLTALTFFSGFLILTPIFFYQKLTPFFEELQPPYMMESGAIFTIFDIHPKAIFGILYMSIFSSIIAYTTYNWGLSLIEASEATLFTYLQPIFAAPLAYFWLKETITAPFLIGASLIALGVFLTEYRGKKSA